MDSKSKNSIVAKTIQDNVNYLYVAFVFVMGGIILLMAFDRGFATTTKDALGLAAIGLFVLLWSLLIVFRLNITS